MAEYSKLVTTALGQALIAKVIAGTASEYDFTRIVTSTDEHEVDDLEDLTSLTEAQSSEIASKTIVNNNGVQVSAAFTNAELTEGYYMNTIGLYANDPDDGEILFAACVETTGNCYMPPNTGTTVSSAIATLTTYVSNSESVSLEIDPAAVATVTMLDEHTSAEVMSEDGSHGIRYYNDVLQVYDSGNEEWIDINAGTSIIQLPTVVIGTETYDGSAHSPSITYDTTHCTISGTSSATNPGTYTFTIGLNDPDNMIWTDMTTADKEYTWTIDKAAAAITVDSASVSLDKDNTTATVNVTVTGDGAVTPTSSDETIATASISENVLTISSVNNTSGSATITLSTAETDYYLAASATVTVTASFTRVMTAIVDLSNSNPDTCVTYSDDAADMEAGSSDWDDFFGHYPCLLSGGVEGVKLNPDNFAVDVDGNSVDLTGGSGDVMIAFPRRDINISLSGTTLTIQMTDELDADGFTHHAHRRGSTAKDKFYLGAYKGVVSSSKMRSISGSSPTGNATIGTFRTYAQNNGDGYENSGFYQLIYRQVMFILKYKTLNSQTAVGYGYVASGHSATIATGGSEAYGMDSELIKVSNPSYMTDQNHHVKCFGLEDFWGNIWEWIDGVVTSGYNILTATTDFNDSGSGYDDQGASGFSSNTGGYMNLPQGTSEKGFLIKVVSGSDSTYFCDYGDLNSSCVAVFGGLWGDATYAGAFRLSVYYASSSSSAHFGGRLMYLEPNAA